MRWLLAFLVMLSALITFEAAAQDKAPSYFEMDDYNHRYPETDTNIDYWLRSWKNSPVYSESAQHGGWIERPYLTQGDPVDPPRPGAVLKYMKFYNHGNLDAHAWTQPASNKTEQAFFYIIRGEGRVVSGGESYPIADRSGVFVPAGVEYQFYNDSDFVMEAVIAGEEISADFEPLTEIKVGSAKEHMPRPGMHWAHIGRSIVDGMKWENPVGFSDVSLDAWDMAQPHMHGPGVEEVWCQVKGNSLLMFGNQLRVQEEGMAFLIPPTFKIPHSSINGTDEPMRWLYMGNRHDDRSRATMEGHIPGWKGMIYDQYGIEY